MRFRKCVGSLSLLSLLTAACGGGASPGHFDPGGSGSTDGTGTSPGTAATGSAGGVPDSAAPTVKTPQSAMTAYRDYQKVYEKVYETGDPSPLYQVATDPQLSRIVKDVASVRSQGIIWRFHNVLNPRIQGRSGDDSTVVILDCVRTLDAYRYSAKTGKRLGSLHGGASLFQAIMKFDGGQWKISDAKQGGKC